MDKYKKIYDVFREIIRICTRVLKLMLPYYKSKNNEKIDDTSMIAILAHAEMEIRQQLLKLDKMIHL